MILTFPFLLSFLFIYYVNATVVRQWHQGDVEYKGELVHEPVKDGFCDPDAKSTSGYFQVDGRDNLNYFFWHFESRSDPDNDPLAIWLTGGPGCSSQLALMYENGPCKVTSDGLDTSPNEHSWNSKMNIMWVDQPAGVGYSYGSKSDYSKNEDDVGANMYNFLQAFFEANPQYVGREFFVFGESYGGHYAPAVAHAIWEGNIRLLDRNKDQDENAENSDVLINLRGLGVGNGLTHPEVQYQYYADMAYNNSYGIHTVSEATYRQMKAATPACIDAIKMCQSLTMSCKMAQTLCDLALIEPYTSTGLNPYDVRIPCEVGQICYDISPITNFLNLPSTLEALHIDPANLGRNGWESCNNGVNRDFAYDWMKSFEKYIPPLLAGYAPPEAPTDGPTAVEEGKKGGGDEKGGSGLGPVRVLIYAGDADFICNWMGNKAWTVEMEWAGKVAFNQAPDQDYILAGTDADAAPSSPSPPSSSPPAQPRTNLSLRKKKYVPNRAAGVSEGSDKAGADKAVGEYRTYGGLTFLRLFGAGHMVPLDQPVVSLDMVNSFTDTNVPFAGFGYRGEGKTELEEEERQQEQPQPEAEQPTAHLRSANAYAAAYGGPRGDVASMQ